MRIAILYICTGKYEKFWDEFYDTCQEHFYPGIEKTYFVFTNSKRIIRNSFQNVKTYYQAQIGWPYDTLLRFHMFSSVTDWLRDYDFCYFFNANSVVLSDVTEEMIEFPNKTEPLIFWCHSNFYDDDTGTACNPERNPESTACVEEGQNCRGYGGGFFGGTSEAFIQMSYNLRDNIQADLSKGIIARWHDQSHIIKYAINHPHKEVPKDLICQEQKKPVEGKCVIVFKSKDDNGGTDSLRGRNLRVRIRHAVIQLYSKLLKGAEKVGLQKPLKSFAGLFKNRKEWYR